MICQFCKKNEATIHLTQIVNGEIKKIDLCEECSKKLGLNKDMAFPVMEALQEISSQVAKHSDCGEGLTCPYCGYTLQDIEKKGRIGCPECYDVFADKIESVLKEVQRDNKHIGKSTKVTAKKKKKPVAAKTKNKKDSDIVKSGEYSMNLSDTKEDTEKKTKPAPEKKSEGKKACKITKGGNNQFETMLGDAGTAALSLELTGDPEKDCEKIIATVQDAIAIHLSQSSEEFPPVTRVPDSIRLCDKKFGPKVISKAVDICRHMHILKESVEQEDYERADASKRTIRTFKEELINRLKKFKKQ